MIKALQRRFALSRQGAVDLIKGCIACVVQDISFMIPVGLLYAFVMDMMNGGVTGSRVVFYASGILVCLFLIFDAAYFKYNATYQATYLEIGKACFLSGTAPQNSVVLFWQKGSCRFDKLHYGRLRHAGNGVFPLCARLGRFPHFHNADCGLPFCL